MVWTLLNRPLLYLLFRRAKSHKTALVFSAEKKQAACVTAGVMWLTQFPTQKARAVELSSIMQVNMGCNGR